MRKSVLILMLDVLVLSVLSMIVGERGSQYPLPVYRWANVVEQGMAKEDEYHDRIALLEQQLDERQGLLKEAAENMRKVREQENRTRLEADFARKKNLDLAGKIDQMEKLLAQTHASLEQERKKVEQATDQKHRTEMDVALEQEKRKLTREELARLNQQQQDAMARIKDMEKKVREAEFQAKIARDRQQQATARMLELAQREKQTRNQVAVSEQKLEHKEKQIEMLLNNARTAEADARKRELLALAEMEEAVKREQRERDVAREHEEARKKAEQQARTSQNYIIHLHQNLADAKIREKQALSRMEVAREKAEMIEERLDDLRTDRKGSLWVLRDKAIRHLIVIMVEEDFGSINDLKDVDLYLPLIKLGEQCFLPSHFRGLELDWWEIHNDSEIVTLRYTMECIGEDRTTRDLTQPIFAPDTEPRFCLIPVQGSDAADALEVKGIEAIKQERLQTAFLFPQDNPNRGIQVDLTPTIQGDYLMIKPSDSKAKLKPREGDYLLTDTGRFVGIMVTKEKCYVMPKTMLPHPARGTFIPLRQNEKNAIFKAFVQAADNVRDKIRKLPDEKGFRLFSR